MRLFLFLLIVIPFQGFSQKIVNPFDNKRNEYNSLDFIAVWNDQNENLNQQVYGYDWIRGLNRSTNDWTRILPLSGINPSRASEASQGYISVETGNFNGNERADVFYLIQDFDGWRFGVSEQQSAFNTQDSVNNFTLPAPCFVKSIENIDNNSFPVLAKGDFNGDGLDQIAIGWTFNQQVLIKIISFEQNGNCITPKFDFATVEGFSISVSGIPAISITAADLNGDGDDELAIQGIDRNTTDINIPYQVYVSTLDFRWENGLEVVPEANLFFDTESISQQHGQYNENVNYVRTAIKAVRPHQSYDQTGPESLFVAFAYDWGGESGSSGENYNYLNTYLLSSSNDLTTISVDDQETVMGNSSPFPSNSPFEAKTGDLNNDGQDDVVLLIGLRLAAFTFEEGKIVVKNINSASLATNQDGSNLLQESVDRLDVGDIDRDGLADIVVLSKQYLQEGPFGHQMRLEAFIADSNFQLVRRGVYELPFVESGNTQLSHGFAIGNLDGTDLRLGEPVSNGSCTWFRPTLVLGCVPYHFDVLNGNLIDLNDYFSSSFNSVTMSTEETSEIASSIKWSAAFTESQALNATYIYEGIGGSSGVEKQNGSSFSSFGENALIQRARLDVTANKSDFLQGYTYPFEISEYPVLNAVGDTTSWILAFIPEVDGKTADSDGRNILNYIPNYEVGNVLSYPLPGDSDNFYDISSAPDALIWESPFLTLTSGTESTAQSFQEDINSSIQEESSFSLTSVSADVQAGGFGLGLNYSRSGTYQEERLQTARQQLTRLKGFEIAPKALTNIGTGSFNYRIKGYLYWTNGGFLKLSMAAEVADGAGGTDWRQNYGQKPDPALNMPWRYDTLKFNPQDQQSQMRLEENLNRTRSIRFDKVNPNPGDTTTAFIRIFNYSLKGMTDPVEFKLYLGDPDQNGTPIADINGRMLFNSQEALGVQGRNVVEVPILVSNEMVAGADNRIYIVLDPDNKINEIHEGNNKGYANIGYACNQLVTGGIVPIDELDVKNGRFLFSVFPNPAYDVLNFTQKENPYEYAGDIQLMIYDLTGRLVHQGKFSRTYNTYSVDVSNLQQGAYFYQIVVEKGIAKTGKIIVNR